MKIKKIVETTKRELDTNTKHTQDETTFLGSRIHCPLSFWVGCRSNNGRKNRVWYCLRISLCAFWVIKIVLTPPTPFQSQPQNPQQKTSTKSTPTTPKQPQTTSNNIFRNPPSTRPIHHPSINLAGLAQRCARCHCRASGDVPHHLQLQSVLLQPNHQAWRPNEDDRLRLEGSGHARMCGCCGMDVGSFFFWECWRKKNGRQEKIGRGERERNTHAITKKNDCNP